MDLNAKLQQVLSIHKAGNIDEAIKGYTEIIPLMPSQIKLSLYGNLGALYMGKGMYSEAKDQFAAAVQISPDHSSSQFNLAVILTSKFNEHAKALKHCALAIRADPTSHKAYHLMGNILQNLGKHNEAEKYFEKAEALAGGTDSNANHNQHDGNTQSESASKGLLNSVLRFELLSGQTQEVEIEGMKYSLRCLSRKPLVFVIDNLLSATECELIKDRAINSLDKSFVMGSDVKSHNLYNLKDGTHGDSDSLDEDPRLYRSSYTAWLPRDDILDGMQRRLAAILGIPLPYIQHKSEDLQVVKYNRGGQFKAHQDSSHFHPRLLTALVYLHTVKERPEVSGGETWFPFAPAQQAEAETLPPPSTIEEAVVRALEAYEDSPRDALPGLAVEPVMGRAVIFFNYDLESGELDPMAVHAGLPVRVDSEEQIDAKKWIANYWIENDPKLLADLLRESDAR